MTVIKSPLNNRFRYGFYCANADTKPTTASSNAKPGDTLFVYDTGVSYITYDGTNWVELSSVDMSTVEALLTTIDADTSNLDIALSALLSGIKGASSKDITTLQAAVALLQGASNKDLTTLETLLATALTRDTTKWGGTSLTGRDISADLANLDLKITDLRTAIRGASTKDFTTLETLLATALTRDITKWGGTALTGADITTYLAELAKIISATPTLYAVTMTNANTEYSQLLTTGTKKLMFHCQDGTAFRYAWVTGKVATPTAPYITVPANTSVNLDGLYLTSKTLYVACASTGKIIEIEEWV